MEREGQGYKKGAARFQFFLDPLCFKQKFRENAFGRRSSETVDGYSTTIGMRAASQRAATAVSTSTPMLPVPTNA